MVDYGQVLPERPHEEFYLKKMRPGDIYTHIYRKFDPTLDENGKVRAYLFEAKKRGVIFDVGHGGGSHLALRRALDEAGLRARFDLHRLHVGSTLRDERHRQRNVKVFKPSVCRFRKSF